VILRAFTKRKKGKTSTKKNKQAEKGIVLYGLDLDLAHYVLFLVAQMS